MWVEPRGLEPLTPALQSLNAVRRPTRAPDCRAVTRAEWRLSVVVCRPLRAAVLTIR
jgi:hypothetical protein